MTNITNIENKKAPSLLVSLVLSISIFLLTKNLGELMTLLFYSVLPKSINITLNSTIGMIITLIALVFISNIFMKKIYKINVIKEINESNETSFMVGAYLGFFALGSVMIQLIVSQFIFSVLGEPTAQGVPSTTEVLKGYAGLGAIFVGYFYPIVIAPILEEYLFRGVVGSIFRIKDENVKTINIIFFVIVSSTMFACLHYQPGLDIASQVNTVVLTLITGIIYSSFYAYTGNIFFVILLHVFQNSFAIFG